MLFEGIAFAQLGAPASGGQDWSQILGSPIIPIAFIFVIMYFLILRPQTKKASDHQKMLGSLKRNDEVVTTGGLIGKIAELGDKVITLEIAPNVRVRVERSQIAASSNYGKPAK
jgi:preprotein translocase subunit YajC